MTTIAEELPQRGPDWIAVGLELAALASIPIVWGIWLIVAALGVTDPIVLFGGTATIGLGSGLGWWRAGDVFLGCVFALTRAVGTAVTALLYVAYALRFALCEGPRCPNHTNHIADAVLIALFAVAYVAIPLLSAFLLALVTRSRRSPADSS